MTFRSSALIAAALFGLALAAPHPAEAMGANPGVTAPSLAETVACRTVRTRVVKPNGRVVYRTKRQCGPHFGRHHRDHCKVVKKRIVRANGSVVHKKVRRCR